MIYREEKQYWGSGGAGCIFLALSTGRLLLSHRSDYVNEPNTWGVWGRKNDHGESSINAVEREIEEETGYYKNYKLIPIYIYQDGNFKYHNYLAIVKDEFTPRLDWETQDYEWVEYGKWPSPLHYGLKDLITNGGNKIKRIVDKVKNRNNSSSSYITEYFKPDLSNKESAAIYIIKKVWNESDIPNDDRFSYYQLDMWIHNNKELSDEYNEIAKKFYPNAEEPAYEFDKDVEKTLEKLEQKYQERKLRKINKDDPLFILKQVVKNKTWEGAKQALQKVTLGAWGYRGGRVNDEMSEEIFNRLYKNAMGETVYTPDYFNRNKKLSDYVRSDKEDHNSKIENYFINYWAGRDKNKFPDKVKIYRGVNTPNTKIRPGDFVTFDADYARSYKRGKFGSIIVDILNSKDLYVYRDDINNPELIYWPEGHNIKKYSGYIPSFKEFWEMFR
jgi:8-oxo-dGTP pyrophosphatase MutT (NUDIX family)